MQASSVFTFKYSDAFSGSRKSVETNLKGSVANCYTPATAYVAYVFVE